MLIKCPDCKKSISSDCERCARCGCIIDSSTMIFEPAPKWSGLGIASFVMVPVYVYFISIIAAIMSGISMAMVSSGSEGTGGLGIVFFLILLYPIIQLILAYIPLSSDEPYHKWPSIVGIVGGCIGIIIGVAFTCFFIWVMYLA